MLETLLSLVPEYKLIVTLLVVTLVVVAKYFLVRLIRGRAKNKGKDRRDLVNTFKNLINFMLIIVLLNFWSAELQKFAFSVAAFVVAFVLATREFIQCLIGFLYLITTRPFRIGDWIQVGTHCGEVNATDWAKLTLLEVDIETYSYTGKTLYLPNNQLIANPIKNLNFMKRYVSHHFTITRDSSVNPFLFLETVKENAAHYCEHFCDVAARYNHLLEKRLDINIAGPEPEIHIATSEIGDTQTEFTIFCPTDQALEIEQKLTADFMQHWFAEKRRNFEELNEIESESRK
ncbi:MAG: small-conductance mechanosensitive channel [Paraglaciecola sp.]